MLSFCSTFSMISICIQVFASAKWETCPNFDAAFAPLKQRGFLYLQKIIGLPTLPPWSFQFLLWLFSTFTFFSFHARPLVRSALKNNRFVQLLIWYHLHNSLSCSMQDLTVISDISKDSPQIYFSRYRASLQKF